MEKTNLKRKVDNIGRVTIPSDLRRLVGISEHDDVNFVLEEGNITIKRIENNCVICGRGDTHIYKEKYVCTSCLGDLQPKLEGMSIEDFQKESLRTMKSATAKDIILNCCLGTSGEFAEVTEHIKKTMFQGHPMKKPSIVEELGDTMFYLVNLASALNIDMRKVLENNVRKLQIRYPNGFSSEDSVKRVDYNESV